MNTFAPLHERLRSGKVQWFVVLLVWAILPTQALGTLVLLSQYWGSVAAAPSGQSAVQQLVVQSLLFPGFFFVLPLMLRPRWTLPFCAVLLSVTAAAAGFSFASLYREPAYWVGSELPVVLLALATLIAFRSRKRYRASA